MTLKGFVRKVLLLPINLLILIINTITYMILFILAAIATIIDKIGMYILYFFIGAFMFLVFIWFILWLFKSPEPIPWNDFFMLILYGGGYFFIYLLIKTCTDWIMEKIPILYDKTRIKYFY